MDLLEAFFLQTAGKVVDPLICSKCQGSMKIIAFIEQEAVIKKFLQNVGLWLARAQPREIKDRPQPKVHSPRVDFYKDYCDSQIPHRGGDYSNQAKL